tara:strand:+ start:1549 stop:1965 length:417 start_codon:yes stop_codon:yes gene_type:complete
MFDEQDELCCDELGGTVSAMGLYCENIPVPEGSYGLGFTTDPCNYNSGAQVQQEVQEEDAGNPFNWEGFNSLLSTLGGIAVPFLPFLFGDDQTNPNIASNPQLEQAEYERKQGQKLVIGFVILIALSVGVYMLMKRKK